MVYQDVTRLNTLPIEAKGLYAYLASLSDVNDECYPTVDLICHELGISKDRFYKYMRILVAAGVVKKVQIKTEGCRFGRNVYKLTHEVYFSEKPYTEKSDTEIPTAESKDTNNKSINNKSINNKNIKHGITFHRHHHCRQHISHYRTLPPYCHQDRILHRHPLLVGISRFGISHHRCGISDRGRSSVGYSWRLGSLQSLEHR